MKYIFTSIYCYIGLITFSFQLICNSPIFNDYKPDAFYISTDSLASKIYTEQLGEERHKNKLNFELNFYIFFTDSIYLFLDDVQIIDQGDMTMNEINILIKEFINRCPKVPGFVDKINIERKRHAGGLGANGFYLVVKPLNKKEYKKLILDALR